MRYYTMIFICISFLTAVACQNNEPNTNPEQEEMEDTMNMEEDKEQAVVTNVAVSGSENAYTFSVTIESPDTGCDQYADWWEVFTEDGTLIYRRILGHSHVEEQPFTRSGGAVEISADTKVIVRAHMNPLGYGTNVFMGSVNDGFEATEISSGTASELESQAPLPTNCAF